MGTVYRGDRFRRKGSGGGRDDELDSEADVAACVAVDADLHAQARRRREEEGRREATSRDARSMVDVLGLRSCEVRKHGSALSCTGVHQ